MSNYICPKCKGQLQINGKVIFSTQTLDNKKGLILMDPRIGVYDYIYHPDFEFIKGELVEFYCPICHANLRHNESHENLACVLLDEGNGEVHDLLFSRRAGEKCTFRIKGSEIESYGEDSKIYFDVLSMLK